MHSNIIQVSNKPIAKGEHISIDSVTAGDMASINYAYKTSEERRKLEITDLVGYILPKGMFTVNSDGETLTYKGGFNEWRKSYLDSIRTKAQEVDEGNIMQWIGPAYQLQKAILDPPGTDTLLVTEFYGGGGMAERSRELMTIIGNMQAGERLYIGAVLGYHF